MNNLLYEMHNRFELVMSSKLSDFERNKKLAALMTQMEIQFKIPMQRNIEWEKENRKVIALYRKISLSREL